MTTWSYAVASSSSTSPANAAWTVVDATDQRTALQALDELHPVTA